MSGRYDYTTASSLSLVLMGITFLLLFAQERLAGERRFSPEANARWAASTMPLRQWKPAALALVWGIVALGVVIPLGILLFWWSQTWGASEFASRWNISAGDLVWSGLTSLGTSAAAATLAVGLALPLAYWLVRSPESKAGKLLSWIAQSGVALPGVLTALGLAMVLRGIAPKLTFSLLALVLAYLVHFFAQALQPLRSGLTQISERFEEESKLLGCSPIETFWLITRPMIQPALFAGWMLVFFSAMRELPASLLLRPAGFDPLTVRVWIAASEGFYAQAAVPALGLVVLSLPLMLWVLRTDGTTSAQK